MRIALWLAYDGAEFRGFAINPDVPTVGGALREALEKIFSVPVSITCAGRTDAGVHARAQVVTFDAPRPIELRQLQKSLNMMCRPSIVVDRVEEKPTDFDARGSALSRSYRYSVLSRPWPDPLRRRNAWHVRHRLDLDAMNDTAQVFVGLHDFASFCRRKVVDTDDGEITAPTHRRVFQVGWTVEGADDGWGEYTLAITANAFCTQMVRSLVAAMVDVGLTRRSKAEVVAMLERRDRRASGGYVAPPHGLVLWEVAYE